MMAINWDRAVIETPQSRKMPIGIGRDGRASVKSGVPLPDGPLAKPPLNKRNDLRLLAGAWEHINLPNARNGTLYGHVDGQVHFLFTRFYRQARSIRSWHRGAAQGCQRLP